jgi:hypothetical protein
MIFVFFHSSSSKYCPFNFIRNQDLLKISFGAFSILSAYSEDTRKVFKLLWTIYGKYLAVFGEYAESIEA